MRRTTTVAVLLGAVAGIVLAGGCSGGSAAEPSMPTTARSTGVVLPSPVSTTAASATDRGLPPLPAGWTDDEITFVSAGVTVHGTLRHPVGGPSVPGALLIAGSGPTDRDGNSPLIAGKVDSLKAVAGWLAQAGVASLRYDKLGSGATGLGRYATDPAAIDVAAFAGEARDALSYLASRPGIDPDRLSVYGHSEGGLFALQLATQATAPAVRAVGLLEPLSRRYLDLISRQIHDQVAAATAAGSMTAADGDRLLQALTAAIAQLRASGTVPADLPAALATVFNPSSLTFLQQMDTIDPVELARTLPAAFPVLLTCSDADIQISCEDVDQLATGLTTTRLDLVKLTGVSHVLKQDPSRSPANYGAALPFSPRLGDALVAFARSG